MLVVRTDEQKASMIEGLRQMKNKAPEFTFFGDNNHAGIDAQIAAIEEEWSEDDCYDKYPDMEEDSHTRDMALDAVKWLNGQEEDDVLLGQW